MINNESIEETKIPTVSICCFTYNQEKFIKQTLESLLMQNSSFPIEIIVHDDASTDNTKKIIEEYASTFPSIIKPIFQKKNKYSTYGMNYIFKHVASNVSGKYIAVCAGDDYWIDPLKIQKQVSFLELNPEYGLVHTKAANFSQMKNRFEGSYGVSVDSIEELLTECSIAALTVCMRSSLLQNYFEQIKPETHSKWTAEDFPTWIWFMQHSKFKFLEDFTAVYRSHLGSISHIEDESKRLIFNEGIYDVVDYYLFKLSPVKNEKIIRSRYYSDMIKLYFLNKRWDGVRDSLKIFYNANDWMNLFWLLITLPFSFSVFMIKGSYRIRSFVFNLLNVYPVRK